MPLKWRVWTVNSLSESFASYVRSTPAAARSTCTARRRVWRTISPPKWKTLNMAPVMCCASIPNAPGLSLNAARENTRGRIFPNRHKRKKATGFRCCFPPEAARRRQFS